MRRMFDKVTSTENTVNASVKACCEIFKASYRMEWK